MIKAIKLLFQLTFRSYPSSEHKVMVENWEILLGFLYLMEKFGTFLQKLLTEKPSLNTPGQDFYVLGVLTQGRGEAIPLLLISCLKWEHTILHKVLRE